MNKNNTPKDIAQSNEELRKQFEEEWKILNISNDFIFGKAVENPEISKRLIEASTKKYLGEKITNVVQKSIKNTVKSKGVRFDVYVETLNSMYDIEMQVGNYVNLPKRSRYYQGSMDMNVLEKGKHYLELKKSFIIFVCKEDPFGLELPIYTFENVCQENNNKKLNDRSC